MDRRGFLRAAAAAGGGTGLIVLDKGVAGKLLESGSAMVRDQDFTPKDIITSADMVKERVAFSQFADSLARAVLAAEDNVFISHEYRVPGHVKIFRVRSAGLPPGSYKWEHENDLYPIEIESAHSVICPCGAPILDNKGPRGKDIWTASYPGHKPDMDGRWEKPNSVNRGKKMRRA